MEPLRFGWSIETNMEYSWLDRAIKQLPGHAECPNGYGIDDGQRFYIQVEGNDRVVLRKNARPVMPGMRSRGVAGGELVRQWPMDQVVTTAAVVREVAKALKEHLGR